MHTHTHTHACTHFSQAVQNRLYNDHAAIYYLLLNKWEKGQLLIPPNTPPIHRPRLSSSGIPPVVPHISIENSELNTSESSMPANNPFHNVPPGESQEESDDYMKDPTLARYLQHGRRHTLGAAHNYVLIQPDGLRLRGINEGSSGNRLDSTNSQFLQVSSGLQQTLSYSTGVDNSSQSSIGSMSRQYLQPPRVSRMGRRASDGGPYATAYKMYIEKRTPQLAQINSSSSIDRSDSARAGSVKQLLEERKVQTSHYGRLTGLPTTHKQWLQYKNQVCTVYVSY